MKRFLLFASAGALVLTGAAKPAGADQVRATAANSPGGSSQIRTSATPVGAPAAKTGTPAVKPGRDGLVPPPPAIPLGIPRSSQVVRPTANAAAAKTDASKILVVGTGGPFALQGRGNVEQFPAQFSWKPDNATDPLKLEVQSNFSDASQPRWNYMRVSIGNRLLATEKSFKRDPATGADVLTIDLTGTVDNGVNQIMIQGAGQRGASVKWSLTSVVNPKMISLEPDEVLQGDRVTIKGQNFPTDASKLIVNLGKKQVPVRTATSSELKFDVPKNADIDEHVVTISMGGKKIPGQAKLIVRGIPRLTSTNVTGVPPGYPIVIFGQNFSKKLGENQVTINEVSAQVTAGTTDQLTIICPSQGSNFYDGGHGPMDFQTYIPIKLKVGKIECKDRLQIIIGNSVWQDPGLLGGKEVPEVPVDVRNNF